MQGESTSVTVGRGQTFISAFVLVTLHRAVATCTYTKQHAKLDPHKG